MSKKRSLKQKKHTRHPFLVNWQVEPKKRLELKAVKGQKKAEVKPASASSLDANNAELLDKDTNIASITKQVIKSLVIVSLILGLEMVIYLVWR